MTERSTVADGVYEGIQKFMSEYNDKRVHDLRAIVAAQQDANDFLLAVRASSLELDDYEAVNLLWLLRVARRLDLDTGDWCHQITHKLEARGHTSISAPNSSPKGTEERLQHAARKILGPQDETAWLVERTDAPAPLYMSGRLTWSESANDAVRFTRREDAEAFAPVGAAFRVCEHIWVAPNKIADSASANPKSTP